MAKINQTPKQQGRCIFCGRTGLTKEHVFSDWLRKILPPTSENSQLVFRTVLDHSRSVIEVRPEIAQRQGALGQIKFRNVCKVCNSGWMSGIVARAKPHAYLLVQGKTSSLDPEAQKDMSAWIALATIMAEFSDRKTMAIPPSDRFHLCKTLAPPSLWTIAIGRYMGASWSPMRYRHHGMKAIARLPNREQILVQTQVTTYALGALLIHAFSSTHKHLCVDFRRWRMPKNLQQIWPRSNTYVEAGNGPVLGDNEVESVADGYFKIASALRGYDIDPVD